MVSYLKQVLESAFASGGGELGLGVRGKPKLMPNPG
jgi:hypothetical protein